MSKCSQAGQKSALPDLVASYPFLDFTFADCWKVALYLQSCSTRPFSVATKFLHRRALMRRDHLERLCLTTTATACQRSLARSRSVWAWRLRHLLIGSLLMYPLGRVSLGVASWYRCDSCFLSKLCYERFHEISFQKRARVELSFQFLFRQLSFFALHQLELKVAILCQFWNRWIHCLVKEAFLPQLFMLLLTLCKLLSLLQYYCLSLLHSLLVCFEQLVSFLKLAFCCISFNDFRKELKIRASVFDFSRKNN